MLNTSASLVPHVKSLKTPAASKSLKSLHLRRFRALNLHRIHPACFPSANPVILSMFLTWTLSPSGTPTTSRRLRLQCPSPSRQRACSTNALFAWCLIPPLSHATWTNTSIPGIFRSWRNTSTWLQFMLRKSLCTRRSSSRTTGNGLFRSLRVRAAFGRPAGRVLGLEYRLG